MMHISVVNPIVIPKLGMAIYHPFLVKLGMVCSSVYQSLHLQSPPCCRKPKRAFTQADVASYSSVIHASNSGNISQKVA